MDGTLLVGPDTGARRAVVVSRLGDVLRAALPDGLRLLPVRYRCGWAGTASSSPISSSATPRSSRAAHGGRRAVLDAADALMVIEVVGRDHGATDRTFKPQLYARSRIPYSLLIDHDAPFAIAEMIISGRYHEYAQRRRGRGAAHRRAVPARSSTWPR